MFGVDWVVGLVGVFRVVGVVGMVGVVGVDGVVRFGGKAKSHPRKKNFSTTGPALLVKIWGNYFNEPEKLILN